MGSVDWNCGSCAVAGGALILVCEGVLIPSVLHGTGFAWFRRPSSLLATAEVLCVVEFSDLEVARSASWPMFSGFGTCGLEGEC